MSFLSNPRSAKLRNSYVNGFLDCSGDIVLRSGNVIIGNISQPGYNANQLSVLIHGRTQMNGNVIVNGNLLVSSNNIALGLRAGNIVNGIQDGVPNGLNSTAVGSFSGMNHTGQNNTFMGSVAGQASSTTYFSRTGNNNTYVGHRTSASQSAWADSTAVGTGAVITASNQIVLGTTAETVSIPGKIYASNLASSYNSANASGSDSWVRVGVFSAPQSGNICVIKIYGNQGYNATINQNYIATIYFKTGNGSSVNATGFAADSHYYIESSSIANSVFIIGDPIWIANAAGLSATTYTLFLNLPAHAAGTHYTVNISPNGLCSWVDSYSFGTAPASTTSSSTCLLSTSSYGIKGNSIAIGLGALTTTSNQIVLGTTAYTVTVPRNLGLVSTTVVSYTQTSSLGFGYGGGTPNGTPYRWKIDDVTLNRDNGAGPNYDYGVQSSLYFRRKTNNLYSGGANDTTYTDSLILSGDGSATITGGLTTSRIDTTISSAVNFEGYKLVSTAGDTAGYNKTGLRIYPYLSAGAFCHLPIAGDAGIIWGSNTTGTNSGFVIAPHTNNREGIRINADKLEVYYITPVYVTPSVPASAIGYSLATKTALYTVGVTPIPAGLKSVYSFSIPSSGVWLISYNLAVVGVTSSGLSEVFISETLNSFTGTVAGAYLGNTLVGAYFGVSSTVVYTATGAITLYLNTSNGGGGVLNGNSYIVRIRIA